MILQCCLSKGLRDSWHQSVMWAIGDSHNKVETHSWMTAASIHDRDQLSAESLRTEWPLRMAGVL